MSRPRPPCEIRDRLSCDTAVPERAGPELAATLNVAVPGPENEDGPATAIQLLLLAAVHGHCGPVVTATVIAPPAVATVCTSGAAT